MKKRIAMAEWRDHRNAERAAASVRAEAECAPARQDQAEHQKAVEEERLFRRVQWCLLGKCTQAAHTAAQQVDCVSFRVEFAWLTLHECAVVRARPAQHTPCTTKSLQAICLKQTLHVLCREVQKQALSDWKAQREAEARQAAEAEQERQRIQELVCSRLHVWCLC